MYNVSEQLEKHINKTTFNHRESKNRREAKELSKFVNDVLKTYDKKLRPNAGGILIL